MTDPAPHPGPGHPSRRRRRRGRLGRRPRARRRRRRRRPGQPQRARARRRPHHAGARRRVEHRRAARRRPGRGRDLQLRQPRVHPLDDGLAADGPGLPRLRRAHRRRPGHRVEPVRLRPRRRADDRGPAAGGDGGEGPRARADVAGRQGRERRRPHPGDGGTRLGLHLPRRAEHARRPRHAADPRGQERAAHRRHRPAAHVDRPDRRRADDRDGCRGRARLGSGVARAEQPAALAARGGGGPGGRCRRAVGEGLRRSPLRCSGGSACSSR